MTTVLHIIDVFIILLIVLIVILSILIYAFGRSKDDYKRIEKDKNNYSKNRKQNDNVLNYKSKLFSNLNKAKPIDNSAFKENTDYVKNKENDLPYAYKTLGFTSYPQDLKAIKQKYKSLVKKAHPDLGGTEAEFYQLQKNYKEAKRLFLEGK